MNGPTWSTRRPASLTIALLFWSVYPGVLIGEICKNVSVAWIGSAPAAQHLALQFVSSSLHEFWRGQKPFAISLNGLVPIQVWPDAKRVSPGARATDVNVVGLALTVNYEFGHEERIAPFLLSNAPRSPVPHPWGPGSMPIHLHAYMPTVRCCLSMHTQRRAGCILAWHGTCMGRLTPQAERCAPCPGRATVPSPPADTHREGDTT